MLIEEDYRWYPTYDNESFIAELAEELARPCGMKKYREDPVGDHRVQKTG